MSNNDHRIVFLDWLRIFSFVSVLAGHKFYEQLTILSLDNSIHASLRMLIQLILPFCASGGAGVVVFFLVSGYIITHVLQKEHHSEFLIRRFFRIYPLYIFAVLLETCFAIVIDHAPISFHTLIPQLLLIGDFFSTPLALNTTEWTLRIEVLFYALMFTLSYLKVIKKYDFLLPWTLVFITLLMYSIPPIPDYDLPTTGYLNIYGPFLFLGAFFFLYQNNKITFSLLQAFIALIFFDYWSLLVVHNPRLKEAHFAILGFGVFVTAWNCRNLLTSNAVILFFSELTYSVYLFHNWLYDRIKAIPIFNNDLCALVILILACSIFVKLIEKPGIYLGRLICNRLGSNKPVFINKPSLIS